VSELELYARALVRAMDALGITAAVARGEVPAGLWLAHARARRAVLHAAYAALARADGDPEFLGLVGAAVAEDLLEEASACEALGGEWDAQMAAALRQEAGRGRAAGAGAN
jgi:hypothetical protein